MLATSQLSQIETRMRAWSFKNRNRHKVDPNFWWKINSRFLGEALEEIEITPDQYDALFMHLGARDDREDVSDSAFVLAAG